MGRSWNARLLGCYTDLTIKCRIPSFHSVYSFIVASAFTNKLLSSRNAAFINQIGITPNDGNGFCTCDNCMALDTKYGDESYFKEEVWKRPDYVTLTGRYVWFWNQLITKMREKNPDVFIGVYLYSAYRNAPKKLKVKPGVWGEIVHGFDFTSWQEWAKSGVSGIALRPNWWHMGSCAPNLPLHQAGAYVEKARNAKMIHTYKKHNNRQNL